MSKNLQLIYITFHDCFPCKTASSFCSPLQLMRCKTGKGLDWMLCSVKSQISVPGTVWFPSKNQWPVAWKKKKRKEKILKRHTELGRKKERIVFICRCCDCLCRKLGEMS